MWIRNITSCTAMDGYIKIYLKIQFLKLVKYWSHCYVSHHGVKGSFHWKRRLILWNLWTRLFRTRQTFDTLFLKLVGVISGFMSTPFTQTFHRCHSKYAVFAVFVFSANEINGQKLSSKHKSRLDQPLALVFGTIFLPMSLQHLLCPLSEKV